MLALHALVAGASVGGTTQREVVWERCAGEGKENEEVARDPSAQRARRIGRSQFELVMGGGMLSLVAGGPLQTLKGPWYKKRPVDNKGLLRRTVTWHLPRSDAQCHGAKIGKKAEQGRSDEEKAV